jgi:hypothetical protein
MSLPRLGDGTAEQAATAIPEPQPTEEIMEAFGHGANTRSKSFCAEFRMPITDLDNNYYCLIMNSIQTKET